MLSRLSLYFVRFSNIALNPNSNMNRIPKRFTRNELFQYRANGRCSSQVLIAISQTVYDVSSSQEFKTGGIYASLGGQDITGFLQFMGSDFTKGVRGIIAMSFPRVGYLTEDYGNSDSTDSTTRSSSDSNEDRATQEKKQQQPTHSRAVDSFENLNPALRGGGDWNYLEKI